MWDDFKNFIKAFIILIKRIWESLGNLLVWAINFFGPVANSVKGAVNPEEFYRILMMALSASGSFYGCIQYMGSHISEFVSDPNLVAGLHAFIDHVHHKRLPLAIFTVIFLGEYFRRKYTHGENG